MLKYIVPTVLILASVFVFAPKTDAAQTTSTQGTHDYCNFNPSQWPPQEPSGSCDLENLGVILCLGACYQNYLDELEMVYEEACDAKEEAYTDFILCMAMSDGRTSQQQCLDAYQAALDNIEATIFGPGEAAAQDNYDACMAWCCEE